MKTQMKKISTGLLLSVLGFCPLFGNAEELTVASGSTVNNYIPFYGQYADTNYQKTEIIYPASELKEMEGSEISTLTFYGSSSSSKNLEGEFTVYLKTVEENGFSQESFSGTENATLVCQGSIVSYNYDISKREGTWKINFDKPFIYNGGNLWVGIYKSKFKNYLKIDFLGKSTNNNSSIYGYVTTGLDNINKGTLRSFLPKATFTYEEAQISDGPILKMDGFSNGAEFDFGGNPVPENTIATFTLRNQGNATLNISDISVSGGYTLSSAQKEFSLSPSETAEITVATPATNTEGELTIVSNDQENSPFVIKLKSIYKVPLPVMVIDPMSYDFGKVTEDTSMAITVSNEGDAPLEATVSSDNQYFVTNVGALKIPVGEEASFTVTFKYNASAYGNHIGNIKITPINTLETVEAKEITVKAKILDPDQWTEDFEANQLPEGWEAGNEFTFENGVVKAKYVYSKVSYLTTPSLIVESGSELSFQYRATGSYTDIIIEASKDNADFKKIKTISIERAQNAFETYTLKDLEPGNYRLRFQNDNYELDNFEGYKLNNNAPRMVLTPFEDIDFGKVYGDSELKVFTVTNVGTGNLNVDIVSDSPDFIVEPQSLTDIGKGENKTFTVKFNYQLNNLGVKTGKITVVPTYNSKDAASINVYAFSKNPDIWEENFESGELPNDWITSDKGGWTVKKIASGIYGGNDTFMASAGTSGNPVLTTPRLFGEKGQELSFFVGGMIDEKDVLKVEYSNDGNEWTEMEISPISTIGDKTFQAPASNYYYIRFTGKYAALDNFVGFKLAPKEHDIAIIDTRMPSSTIQYLEYTASVTVKELLDKDETINISLDVNGKIVDSIENSEIGAGETKTYNLSFIPESAGSLQVKIIVNYAGETSYSGIVTLVVEEAPVLSEKEESEINIGVNPVYVIDYTSKPGWTTICMPFQLNEDILTKIFGEDYMAFEYKDFDNGIISFEETDKFAAGYPYFIYAPNGTTDERIILKDVRFDRSSGQADSYKGITFQGTFSPVKSGEMTGFFTAENIGNGEANAYSSTPNSWPQMVECDENSNLKGYRAYFIFDGSIHGVPEIQFSDADGNKSSSLSPIGKEVTIYPEGIYTLQGIKISNPSIPGIYIVNGKKTYLK